MCCEDFNEVLYSFEKMGRHQRDFEKIEDFHDSLYLACLEDLSYLGFGITLMNGMSVNLNIQECLDRFLAN